MDRSETLARDHLRFRGHVDVVYEPDGNVPPDFLVDGRIAVEVRRLNENQRDLPEPKGLEEAEIPLLQGMQKLIKSFVGATVKGWWLHLSYKRPFPRWHKLEPAARAFLEGVRDGAVPARRAHRLHDNVEIEAISRVGTDGDLFALAITSDDDSGGWVLEELERNLLLVIDEKTQKIKGVRGKYPVWWLLLVDQVAYGLSEYDRASFKADVRISHSWDKIIVVNPLDHTHYFEL